MDSLQSVRWIVTILLLLLPCQGGLAQELANTDAATPAGANTAPAATPAPTFAIPDVTKRENFGPALQLIILLTVLSLAPAIMLMMTSFTRIIIVLSLLRQALGTQQLPPNQILIGLAMFMTFMVMTPTWNKINSDALQPYLNGSMDQRDAMQKAVVVMRKFMEDQIVRQNNDEDVFMMHEFSTGQKVDKLRFEDVGTFTLIPAYILSELKTAFIMGFKIYLPFLIIDIVISSILISMGMMMLPPVLISMPFKLLLFVLVDGWHLITLGLMSSFTLS
jgi:flagellar biosynthetic protein FliP